MFFSAPGIPPWDNIASDVIETFSGEEGLGGRGSGRESGERKRSFRSYCDETDYAFNTSKLNDLGIPTNSVERMLERFVQKHRTVLNASD